MQVRVKEPKVAQGVEDDPEFRTFGAEAIHEASPIRTAGTTGAKSHWAWKSQTPTGSRTRTTVIRPSTHSRRMISTLPMNVLMFRRSRTDASS